MHLPPLRARQGDLRRLIQIFLERAGARQLVDQVGGAALDRLERYHWPGNVRELRNVIARAVALSSPPTGSGDDFQALPILLRPTMTSPDEPPAFRADRPFHEAKDELVDRFEREYLTDLVRRADGNLSEAARLAGLERKFLYKLLERAGLRT